MLITKDTPHIWQAGPGANRDALITVAELARRTNVSNQSARTWVNARNAHGVTLEVFTRPAEQVIQPGEPLPKRVWGGMAIDWPSRPVKCVCASVVRPILRARAAAAGDLPIAAVARKRRVPATTLHSRARRRPAAFPTKLRKVPDSLGRVREQRCIDSGSSAHTDSADARGRRAQEARKRRVEQHRKTLQRRRSWCELSIPALARKLKCSEGHLRTDDDYQPLRDEWESISGRKWPTDKPVAATAIARRDKALARVADDPAQFKGLGYAEQAAKLGVPENSLRYTRIYAVVRKRLAGAEPAHSNGSHESPAAAAGNSKPAKKNKGGRPSKIDQYTEWLAEWHTNPRPFKTLTDFAASKGVSRRAMDHGLRRARKALQN